MSLAEKSGTGELTYTLARKSDPKYIKGRRSFFEYIDLGITDASEGRIRMQITKAENGLSEPTGWHYHVCEAQIVYMTRGWLELTFAGGDVVRVEEGDSLFIPGGLPHNETSTSDVFELLEISVPAKMETVVCDEPG